MLNILHSSCEKTSVELDTIRRDLQNTSGLSHPTLTSCVRADKVTENYVAFGIHRCALRSFNTYRQASATSCQSDLPESGEERETHTGSMAGLKSAAQVRTSKASADKSIAISGLCGNYSAAASNSGHPHPPLWRGDS